MNCTYDYIKSWLQANLSKERFEHSIGTAECAKELAIRFNLDQEKAYLTGLIHDCAKCLPKEKTLDIINKYLDLEEEEKCSPKTHHAPVGAYIAQKEFHITDKEILSAIRWHTIGYKNMTDFEKIIFLADKIETKTRPIEMYKPIREALDISIDKAMLVCYENTIKSLVDRELRICTSTIDIYNSLL